MFPSVAEKPSHHERGCQGFRKQMAQGGGKGGDEKEEQRPEGRCAGISEYQGGREGQGGKREKNEEESASGDISGISEGEDVQEQRVTDSSVPVSRIVQEEAVAGWVVSEAFQPRVLGYEVEELAVVAGASYDETAFEERRTSEGNRGVVEEIGAEMAKIGVLPPGVVGDSDDRALSSPPLHIPDDVGESVAVCTRGPLHDSPLNLQGDFRLPRPGTATDQEGQRGTEQGERLGKELPGDLFSRRETPASHLTGACPVVALGVDRHPTVLRAGGPIRGRLGQQKGSRGSPVFQVPPLEIAVGKEEFRIGGETLRIGEGEKPFEPLVADGEEAQRVASLGVDLMGEKEKAEEEEKKGGDPEEEILGTLCYHSHPFYPFLEEETNDSPTTEGESLRQNRLLNFLPFFGEGVRPRWSFVLSWAETKGVD